MQIRHVDFSVGQSIGKHDGVGVKSRIRWLWRKFRLRLRARQIIVGRKLKIWRQRKILETAVVGRWMWQCAGIFLGPLDRGLAPYNFLHGLFRFHPWTRSLTPTTGG